jgi:hypothetical protein
MSTGAGPDTSVVATCLKKIQDAMGTDAVKVTGTIAADEYCLKIQRGSRQSVTGSDQEMN